MKSHIINKEALSNYFKEHRGKIALINLIILILEQIRDWLEGNQQQQSPKPFSLEDYESLNLTDEHVRKAIVRLREEGTLEAKADWFGVYKVLVWAHIVTERHGTYSGCERYLKRLFPTDPTLDNLQVDLRKKCERNRKLFSKPLSDWCKQSNQCGHVLEVAKRFLALLKEG